MPGKLSQQMQANPSRVLRRALRAYEQGEIDKAERLCNALLHDHPGTFDALHCLGRIHYRRGRLVEALALIQEAIRSDLGRADGFASLGLVFHSLRQFERALTSFDAGLAISSDDADLRNSRGVVLLELNRPHEALEDFGRVLAADPDHLDALGNFGNALIKLNRPAQALAAYDRALTITPGNAQLLTNRAVALRRLDRPRDAVASAANALAVKPDFAQARFVESVARLTLGDFRAGWAGYEARWAVGALASQRRSFAQPLWLGRETLDGRAILLHAEQGLGDTIQFIRFAPLLAARGATVVVEVQQELTRLVAGVAGVDVVVERGGVLPRFDLHCPLLSLPLALATEMATIPAQVPYLAPLDDEVARWRPRLPQSRPRIGLVWSGERTHDNDLNRSLRLETLRPLLGVPNLAFVSLQHEVRAEDVCLLQDCPQVSEIGPFRDFADTAAALASLDAVIAVDTAVAHLAGAMGKPLFLLLPFAADFRWLRERRDSPWYPTARLCRQPRYGDWDSVIFALRQELMRIGSRAAA